MTCTFFLLPINYARNQYYIPETVKLQSTFDQRFYISIPKSSKN
jgi:hypothetical protein